MNKTIYIVGSIGLVVALGIIFRKKIAEFFQVQKEDEETEDETKEEKSSGGGGGAGGGGAGGGGRTVNPDLKKPRGKVIEMKVNIPKKITVKKIGGATQGRGAGIGATRGRGNFEDVHIAGLNLC